MIALMLSSCGGGASTKEGALTEVTIDKQVWMSENLNVDKFRNGDLIPEAKTNEEWQAAGKAKQPAWCYYDNDPKNVEKYGKLYNWFAVIDSRGLAPVGYHIPTDEEWKSIEDFLKSDAGKKMKSTSGWAENGSGTNESGFSGFPGGGRYFDGPFYDIGVHGHWWSSTRMTPRLKTTGSGNGSAWARGLFYGTGAVYRYNFYKADGLSVRCLKD